MPKEAVSLDLDGVVIRRIPFQYYAIRRLFSRPPIDFSPPSEIPELDRTVQEVTPTFKTRINFLRHSLAPVSSDAKRLIPQISDSKDVYANSGGWVNTSQWVDHANATFQKAGPHIAGVVVAVSGVVVEMVIAGVEVAVSGVVTEIVVVEVAIAGVEVAVDPIAFSGTSEIIFDTRCLLSHSATAVTPSCQES